jgi:inner membrane protease subunit 2
MSIRRFSPIISRITAQSKHFFQGSKYVLFATVPWLPAVIFFNDYVAEISYINGASMYPYLNVSYNEGLGRDRCLVNKWYPARNLQRGMLVSFW